jgi:hypothetical protein
MKTNLSLNKVITVVAAFSLLAITPAFAETDVTTTAEDSIATQGAEKGPGICQQVCDGTGKGKAAMRQQGRKGNKGNFAAKDRQGGKGGKFTRGRKGGRGGQFAQGRRGRGGNGGRQGMRQGRGPGQGQRNQDCILNTPTDTDTPEA